MHREPSPPSASSPTPSDQHRTCRRRVGELLLGCTTCSGWPEQDEGPYRREGVAVRRDLIEDGDGALLHARDRSPRCRRRSGHRRRGRDLALRRVGPLFGVPSRTHGWPRRRRVLRAPSTCPSRRGYAAGTALVKPAWLSSAPSTPAGIPAAPSTFTLAPAPRKPRSRTSSTSRSTSPPRCSLGRPITSVRE